MKRNAPYHGICKANTPWLISWVNRTISHARVIKMNEAAHNKTAAKYIICKSRWILKCAIELTVKRNCCRAGFSRSHHLQIESMVTSCRLRAPLADDRTVIYIRTSLRYSKNSIKGLQQTWADFEQVTNRSTPFAVHRRLNHIFNSISGFFKIIRKFNCILNCEKLSRQLQYQELRGI